MNTLVVWTRLFRTTPVIGVISLLLLLTSPAHAGVLLLLSSNASYYRETAEALRAQLSPAETSVEVATIEQQNLNTVLRQPHPLIVAIGSKATRTALDQGGDSALLSIFIPKNAYDALQLPALDTSQRSLSVIYLDQPLNRVVSLAALLEPRATRFGTVFGPISRESEADLKALTNARGITLEQAYLNHEDNPLAILRPLVKQADVFIALPDQAILNRAIAKWILHLSFQQKVPVIGFSKAYTNAGALASIYSAPEDIGKQAGELVRNWLSNPDQRGAQEQYPKYFTISTNPAVARSLNINLPAENQLYRAIEQQEQAVP